MMSEHYMECRTLPTINETFPQFSTRPPQQQEQLQPAPLIATTPLRRTTAGINPNNLILSPLDLSLRAGVNIVPITPPSTPSPPRKRPRFMSDEQYLWRPHVMETPTTPATTTTSNITTNNTTTGSAGYNNFLHTMTYTRREELTSTSSSYRLQEDEGYDNNFGEIPKSQRSGNVLMMEQYERQHRQQHLKQQQHQQHHHHQQQHHKNMATIYVDDDTIVLTEDEDDDEGEIEEDEDADEEDEEENETLVSSQEFNEDDVDLAEESNETHNLQKSSQSSNNDEVNSPSAQATVEDCDADDDEEVYVDILSNDDDEDINPLSGRAITMLRLQNQTDLEQELEKTGKVLTRNKLVYENEELHNRAVNGLAKLFNTDFSKRQEEISTFHPDNMDKEKTYIDLTNCQKTKENPYMMSRLDKEQQQFTTGSPAHNLPSSSSSFSSARPPYKTHKTERKRMKLRKHMSLDEETISPVSGTIIRKLRDDEELVVRKGDIDPAFNVVEVTEEAKAILASIDNKIGDYLCQLCRTLYDDAFKLAQHRCPRIVHIEYKCSECEKVFNCPANLASHRRWHKPKSELLANSQSKKRAHSERTSLTNTGAQDKNVPDDNVDGIFPCSQCGKTFRRHAYLKKHQASHQMLENLKSLDIFKNSATNSSTFPSTNVHLSNHTLSTPPRIQPNALYPPTLQHPRPYPTRFGAFPFPTPFDHRRFYTLGEFYLSQQLERSSAFQYVQANHLRNLSNVAGNFVNRPVVPSPIIPLPVK